MKFLLLLFFYLSVAHAGFPPTTSEGTGDAAPVTTFNFQFPYMAVTRTGVTTNFNLLGVQGGGTGASTLTSGYLLLGNNNAPVALVGPGTTSNVLTSNGATWTSAPPAYTGTVTIINSGTGLLGGPITTTGTLSVDVGTAANKIMQLTSLDFAPAVDGNLLTNLNAVRIQGRAISANAPISGQILSWNASISSWQPLPSPTSIITATGILGGPITTTGTLSVDVGTAANKIVQLTTAAFLPAVDGNLLTNLNAVRIQAKPISANAPTSGQVLTWNASTSVWQPLSAGTGTVTSLITTTGILGGPITTTGTLSVDVGTAANKILQLTTADFVPAVDGNLLTNLNAVRIQGNPISSNAPTSNQVLTWNSVGSNWQALSFKAPTQQTFLIGVPTAYYTFTTSALSSQVVAGAVYTNNGTSFGVIYTANTGATTVVAYASAGGTPTGSGTLTFSSGTGPATITFSASPANGTYQLPTNPSPLYLRVKLVGGGSGGSGSGTSPGNGGAGANTTFSTFLTAGGGAATSGTIGGLGGTNTVSTGTAVVNVAGSAGGGASDAVNANGQAGGASFFGGSGKGGSGGAGTTGSAGAANSGGGGGGAGTGATISAGGGGGSGGYIEYLVTNPSATYTFVVGVGGTAGAGGTGGSTGGAGGSGAVIVEEYYQ